MESLALIAHDSPQAVLAYRGGAPITAARFLAEVERLQASLPAGDFLLNVCTDRYRFAVGLTAALVAHKVSLLPSMQTRESIRELDAFAADAFCLTDDVACDIRLPRVLFCDGGSADSVPWSVPVLDAGQVAAYAFTSGSTGASVAHRKHWGKLVRCVQESLARLNLSAGQSHAIVSTVPPQHMFGLELSVLLALQGGHALCAERPFYPADVRRVLSGVPAPRVLVSTPVHLRTLLASGVELPEVELVVCSTAALPLRVARDIESRFSTRLLEIYGSTETGQLASRRTSLTSDWHLWPDVALSIDDGQAWAQGGHLERRTLMCDRLEPLDAQHFRLHGRSTDLVNIAGKRSSLGYLDHQLHSIPGVIDGAFLMPGESRPSVIGVTRLAAVVVAPGLDARSLIRSLRERIDPAFLPRPLLFVERLPRNTTGKLTRDALQALLRREHGSTATP